MATRWEPDTCSCVVEYDANFVVQAVIRKCSKHAATKSDVEHFDAMLAHNRFKNTTHEEVFSRAVAQVPGLTRDGVSASYDANDILTVTVLGLPPGKVATVQSAIDNKIGAGRASIVAG